MCVFGFIFFLLFVCVFVGERGGGVVCVGFCCCCLAFGCFFFPHKVLMLDRMMTFKHTL